LNIGFICENFNRVGPVAYICERRYNEGQAYSIGISS